MCLAISAFHVDIHIRLRQRRSKEIIWGDIGQERHHHLNGPSLQSEYRLCGGVRECSLIDVGGTIVRFSHPSVASIVDPDHTLDKSALFGGYLAAWTNRSPHQPVIAPALGRVSLCNEKRDNGSSPEGRPLAGQVATIAAIAARLLPSAHIRRLNRQRKGRWPQW